MRTNRNIRIGLFLIGIGIVFLLGWAIIAALRSGGSTTVAEGGDELDNGMTPVNTETQVRGLRVVARESIPGKSILTRDMIDVREVSTDAPEADFIADPDAVLGYVTRDIIINPGDPIRRADLQGHITKVGTSSLVRLGERAMVVPLNQPTLHALIKAGDYVDVVAAFEGQEANTIVRGARVLAVDVFANEYPDVSIAQRGVFKHPPASVDVSAVPTPTPTADPNAPPAAQSAPPPAEQSPAVGEDVPPPAAALTLEVTPEEATRISLAQAADARIDFILIPREEIVVPVGFGEGPEGEGPEGEGPRVAIEVIRAVSTTLPEVAPYTARLNRQASTTGQAAGGQNAGGQTGSINRPGITTVSRPIDERPIPIGERPLPPISIGEVPRPEAAPTPTPLPETYQVKIIPDGKEVRYETVLKPQN